MRPWSRSVCRSRNHIASAGNSSLWQGAPGDSGDRSMGSSCGATQRNRTDCSICFLIWSPATGKNQTAAPVESGSSGSVPLCEFCARDDRRRKEKACVPLRLASQWQSSVIYKKSVFCRNVELGIRLLRIFVLRPAPLHRFGSSELYHSGWLHALRQRSSKLERFRTGPNR
jgi:hypothetical protein